MRSSMLSTSLMKMGVCVIGYCCACTLVNINIVAFVTTCQISLISKMILYHATPFTELPLNVQDSKLVSKKIAFPLFLFIFSLMFCNRQEGKPHTYCQGEVEVGYMQGTLVRCYCMVEYRSFFLVQLKSILVNRFLSCTCSFHVFMFY